jgi:hypothetical protein
MRKLPLAGLAVITLGTTMFVPSLIGRTQSTGGFEYLRVTPYSVNPMKPARVGYRACVATTGEWVCRQFEPQDSSDAGLRTALATLGNEGWELVSAVDDPPGASIPEGLTYLFKRQRQ